jgi:hypothetical protein
LSVMLTARIYKRRRRKKKIKGSQVWVQCRCKCNAFAIVNSFAERLSSYILSSTHAG